MYVDRQDPLLRFIEYYTEVSMNILFFHFRSTGVEFLEVIFMFIL